MNRSWTSRNTFASYEYVARSRESFDSGW